MSTLPGEGQNLPWSACRLGPPVLAEVAGERLVMRVGNDARKMVVFFGIATEKGIEYAGTGFLIADKEDGISMPFLVTCRHVAEPLGRIDEFFIRVNHPDGVSSAEIPFQGSGWAFHPDDTVDLAAMPLVFPNTHFDAIYYNLADTGYLSSKVTNQVACGDPISIVGLFRLHHGKKRNVPIVHSGHVAALLDVNERIPIRDRLTKLIVRAEAYLVEVQTLDGISGSPVFVHECVDLQMLKLPSWGVCQSFRHGAAARSLHGLMGWRAGGNSRG
jgi:hypothetical protein